MRIISLLNLKGGVGKSFSTVNIAYELWRRGYKVLVLDNDKQGNLSKAYQNTDGEKAGLEWLNREWDNVSSSLYRKYPILGVIRYSGKVAENSFLRKPIYEYSPCCAAVQDYKKFITSYTGKGR